MIEDCGLRIGVSRIGDRNGAPGIELFRGTKGGSIPSQRGGKYLIFLRQSKGFWEPEKSEGCGGQTGRYLFLRNKDETNKRLFVRST